MALLANHGSCTVSGSSPAWKVLKVRWLAMTGAGVISRVGLSVIGLTRMSMGQVHSGRWRRQSGLHFPGGTKHVSGDGRDWPGVPSPLLE